MGRIRERLNEVPTKRDWLIPVVLALLSLAASAFANYNDNDKNLTSRIAVVENQQKNDTQRLERIETKLDRFYEYMTGSKP
jgi:hypothetical protein